MQSVRISDLLDGTEAPDIALKERAAVSPERIKEIAMKKIPSDETCPVKGKKRMRRGVVAAIVAAACLLLCGAGYAAGLFRQAYNWRGETVGAPQPEVTVSPQDKIIELVPESVAETIQAIQADRAPRELVVVRAAGGDHFSQRSEAVSSMEELRAKLEAEGSPLRVPYAIPAGYALVDGFVAYESTGGYTLVSSETSPDGLVVDRYTAPPENDFISFYRMDYENEAGDRIFLFARMSQDAAYEFSALTGETMETVTVAGMDEALLHTGAESATLSMLQYLEKPIDFVGPLTLVDKGDTYPFTEVFYMLNATNVDAEALMQIIRP